MVIGKLDYFLYMVPYTFMHTTVSSFRRVLVETCMFVPKKGDELILKTGHRITSGVGVEQSTIIYLDVEEHENEHRMKYIHKLSMYL